MWPNLCTSSKDDHCANLTRPCCMYVMVFTSNRCKMHFLHGGLRKEVYMKLPYGMPTSSPHDVCNKLKQLFIWIETCTQVWFEKFQFVILHMNPPLFFWKRHCSFVLVVLVYVDGIVITGSTNPELVILYFPHERPLSRSTYFLGLKVHHQPQGIFLHPHKYIQDLVRLFGLVG